MCKPEAVSCGGGGGTYNSWRLTHSLLVTWEKKREKCLVLHVHVYNIIGLTSTLFFFSFFSLRQPKSILRVPVSFVTTNCYARVFRSVLPGALVRTVHLAGRHWRRRLSVPNARFTFLVCGTYFWLFFGCCVSLCVGLFLCACVHLGLDCVGGIGRVLLSATRQH